MARPVVLLPHPDSPTSPSVSPLATVNEISSTARTEPTCRWRKPLVIGKCILRCSTRRSSAGPPVLGPSCIGRVEVAMGAPLDGLGSVDGVRDRLRVSRLTGDVHPARNAMPRDHRLEAGVFD